jgi:hypothetical protein
MATPSSCYCLTPRSGAPHHPSPNSPSSATIIAAAFTLVHGALAVGLAHAYDDHGFMVPRPPLAPAFCYRFPQPFTPRSTRREGAGCCLAGWRCQVLPSRPPA